VEKHAQRLRFHTSIVRLLFHVWRKDGNYAGLHNLVSTVVLTQFIFLKLVAYEVHLNHQIILQYRKSAA